MADSEYHKKQDGDSTVFEVTPATAPKNIGGITMLATFVIPLGLIAVATGSLIFMLIVTAIGVGLGILVTKDQRPIAHKSKAMFRVSSSAIEANNRTFNKADIHRLIIQNGVTKNLISETLAIRSESPGAAIGRAYGEKLATVAHSLDVESGGKAYILAGGMDETTAYGLMTDVRKIIGF